MLSFGVTIPATVPQRSDIPEGLMTCNIIHEKFGKFSSTVKICFVLLENGIQSSRSVRKKLKM
jgi:hypothetical protein